MGASDRVDKLRMCAYIVACLSQATFENVVNAERAPDLPDIDHPASVSEARVAGDHEQRLEGRQLGDDVLDYAVAEVCLLRIAAEICERQHRYRWLVGQG